jgi:predicted permease
MLNVFRRHKVQREIDDELRAHIEMRIEDNMAAGMTAEEARRDATVRFGNLSSIEERTGGADVNQFLEGLWRDVSYAARQLPHSRGFAATAVLTLGLAIAANVVVFGVLDSLLLKPLIGTGSDRLFNVVPGPYGHTTQSYPDYVDYRDQNTTFSGVAAYHLGQVALAKGTGAYKCWDYEVSGNYFDALGVQPGLGRFFHSADEHGPDSAPYVVLSDAFWRSYLGGDPHIIGTTVRLNQHPFTVLGVAPPSFHGIERFIWPDIWVPIVNEEQIEGYNFLQSRFNHGIWIIGLLKPGVHVQQATENLNAVAVRLAKQYPTTDEGMKARLVTPGLMGDQFGNAARAFLSAMMMMALLVLLAACANLAGIFGARGADRSRELAIRLAIGSSRWHVLRQLLAETVLIALAGGFLGIVFATVLLHFLSEWQPFTEFPIHVTVAPGARVYLIGLGLSLASGFLPSLLPARQLWRTDLVQAIKGAAVESVIGRRLTLRDLLLAVQVTVCALLLTSALVALRGMERSLHAPLGFDPRDVVLATTDMHMTGYSDDASLTIQKRMLLEAAQSSGVEAAGMINETPLGTGGSSTPVYSATTTDFRPSSTRFGAKFYSISPGYLKAARTRLLAGRDFTWHDDKAAPRVALVNETFARELFGTSFPVGHRFKTSATDSYEIVGVVEDGKYNSLSEEPVPAMFFPLGQNPDSDTTLVVRSKMPVSQTAFAVHGMLSKIDPGLPFVIEPWPQALALVLFPARAATVSLGIMGLLAAMLAVTGVFGMGAYAVSKRKKEFGIRLALGTQRLGLIRTALGRPAGLLLAGSVSGLSLGFVSSRLLGQIVYAATARDPLVFSGALAGMALVGIFATWIPAKRALGIDPAKLLREDF